LICFASSFLTVDIVRVFSSEPTEDWTVEQVIQWLFIRGEAAVKRQAEEKKSQYRKMGEEAVASLWDAHARAVEHRSRDIAGSSSVVGVTDENSDPQTRPSRSKNSRTSKKVTDDVRDPQPTVIHVELTSGEYAGSKFTLTPTLRWPCWVGRSAGKKFTNRGISLPKDVEVSTTHGKFEVGCGGRLYFVDTGSTNGSGVGDERLETKVPVELYEGMKIHIGGTTMKISLS